jgi:quercetin dioxygenase-like cupin family protein
MKRHAGLVPLSHDHHHGLVQARRLRRGADGDRRDAAVAFLAFFAEETAAHFRDEEELVFPLVADEEEARELLAQALIEHQLIRWDVGRLAERVAAGDVDADLMRATGEALEAHIRLEERQLFPLIERLVPDAALVAATRPRLRLEGASVVDPAVYDGRGPVWGTATDDLNATLLVWPAGEGTPPHVNDERDVVVVVLAGSATVACEGRAHALGAGQACIVPKGTSRAITAGPDGVRYLSVHRRRPPLQLRRRHG